MTDGAFYFILIIVLLNLIRVWGLIREGAGALHALTELQYRIALILNGALLGWGLVLLFGAL